jgi:hypothetical protein
LAVARRPGHNQHAGVTGSEAPNRLPTAATANLAALAILAGALVAHLWPEWTHDPDLSHGFLMPLACVLALAAATIGFFAANTRAPVRNGAVPDLLAILPASAQGWNVETSPDLYRFVGTLRTDNLAQRTYVRRGQNGGEQVTLYLAYWSEGQASVGLVGSHTPDACWPGTGWVASDVPDPQVALETNGLRLPSAQHRLFFNGGYPQHVWFWQLYGGHAVDIANPRSVPALIGIALRYGFRKGGDQVFIRASSNRPWDEVSREPFIADFSRRVRRLGLY